MRMNLEDRLFVLASTACFVLAVTLLFSGCKTTDALLNEGVEWLDSTVADYLAKITVVVPPVQEPAPMVPEAPAVVPEVPGVPVTPPEVVAPAVPETPAVVQACLFRYEPRADSITFDIMEGHWQYSICTTTPAVNHVKGLWGLTRGGGTPIPGGTRYTLPGSGEKWRNDALALDPKGGGAIVIFYNLNKRDPVTGWTASHQVVPDPRVKHEVVK